MQLRVVTDQPWDVAADVLVTLTSGSAILVSRITPAAARELALVPGTNAVAVVKSAAVHRLG